MSDESVEALKQVPLFQGMSDKALMRVAEIAKEVSHPAGKTILEEDRSAAGFHLILSGEAQASHAGAALSTMGPGDYFGEMSLIDGKPRSASVTAVTDLRTLAIPAWNFSRLLDDNPEVVRALLVALSERIRDLADHRH
ncbi:MAG: cyclic nucleotide-binding domain-containing protein [Actinomycetota bacterium]|nr:cyclic nucleotide-binding domain-containing protein [Actinomycetota bacterium]MDH5223167.1 cyclic nucleotide-binding domain-containing protein [Actinomycetota bacterium]MDH5312219.1 cyclic nucleotide-binding domain-containing protein [Actinomycetota bacterium]